MGKNEKWAVRAEFNGSCTIVPVNARDMMSGIFMMGQLISVNYVSDERFRSGRIALMTPDEKEVYVIPDKLSKKIPYFTLEANNVISEEKIVKE